MRPVEGAGDPAATTPSSSGRRLPGSWRKEATAYVRRNRPSWPDRPVWLFSSGPLGTETTDEAGPRPARGSAAEGAGRADPDHHPRGHRVFFGALDRTRLGFAERLLSELPAGRELLPEGDFRDWADVDAWAEDIAVHLR